MGCLGWRPRFLRRPEIGINCFALRPGVFREAPIMEEPSSNPAFEARPLKSASGWYVRVAWPNGKCDHVPGFVTQHEAQRWIEGKAPSVVVGALQRARSIWSPRYRIAARRMTLTLM
jgi:hypothetical protein